MLNATQEADLRRLEILLNTLRRGALAVALCEDLALRDELMAALRPRLQHPLHEFFLSPENNDPVLLLQDHTQPGDVAVFYDLEAAGPEAIGRLEFRRELVWEIGASVLLWVTGEGQRLLLRDAPNFYSRRVLLLHFTGASAEKVFFLCGRLAGTFVQQTPGGALLRTNVNRELQAAVEKTVARWRGHMTSAGGDFVATFDNVGDLFNAAFRIRQLVPTAEHYCLGLHYGVAPRRNGQIVGPDLDKARWLSHLGRAGQILFSAELLQIAQEQISGFSFYGHGAIERGVLGKQQVYESVAPGAHPLPLLNEVVPNNLPPRPQLTEHRDELERVVALLFEGENVALVGGAGGGKTTLALEAAHGALLARRFAGGIVWIQARRLTSYDAFRAAFLGVFDMAGGDTPQELDERLNARLRRSPVLVVVDGVDEAPKPAEVWQWLAALPVPTKILVTSRQAPPAGAAFESVSIEGSGATTDNSAPVADVAYYLEQVKQHADLNQKANRDWFDAEWPNIYAAAQQAADAKNINALVSIIDGLRPYFQLRSFWNEWELILLRAVEIVKATGQRWSEAALLNNLGCIYDFTGRWDEAEKAFLASLEYLKEFNDKKVESQILSNLAGVYTAKQQWDKAEKTYIDVLNMQSQIGDEVNASTSLNNLGELYRHQFRFEEAESAFQSSLEIKEKLHDRVGEGMTLGNLGNIYSLTGRWELAEIAYSRGLQICREFGDLVAEGKMLKNLSLLWRAQGAFEMALPYARQAVAILQKTQDAAELEEARGIMIGIEANLAKPADVVVTKKPIN